MAFPPPLGGLFLPHLDYADIIWGDQPGLTTQMKQLQSFQSGIAKKIVKGKVTSAEALTLFRWIPLHARHFGHCCCLVQDTMKGEIPEHFDVFRSTMENNAVTIPKMVACPKLASQEQNGAETK